MGQRLELQSILETFLGSRNVYFQPPATVKMSYPAIVYKRDDIDTTHADNIGYIKATRYMVTCISRDPDATIHERVLELPTSTYVRGYTADSLNHDVINLFF